MVSIILIVGVACSSNCGNRLIYSKKLPVAVAADTLERDRQHTSTQHILHTARRRWGTKRGPGKGSIPFSCYQRMRIEDVRPRAKKGELSVSLCAKDTTKIDLIHMTVTLLC